MFRILKLNDFKLKSSNLNADFNRKYSDFMYKNDSNVCFHWLGNISTGKDVTCNMT